MVTDTTMTSRTLLSAAACLVLAAPGLAATLLGATNDSEVVLSVALGN